MKKIVYSLSLFSLFTLHLPAQIPQLLHYQGRVAVNNVNFDGLGQFKFALVSADGATTYWSQDGSSVNGGEPTGFLKRTVTNGLYSVLLGDATLAGMNALSASVFENTDVHLRVWFNDGSTGFQQLTPDQRIAAVGYAMMAATARSVADGAVTSDALADGAVTTEKLSPGAVNQQLQDEGGVPADLLPESLVRDQLTRMGQSAVGQGGIILSQTENTALETAGYHLIGTMQTQSSWRRLDMGSAPTARIGHTAVWTGTEWIIWGGTFATPTQTGARYNPAANRWTPVGTEGAPSARSGHTAVWTGTHMLVWGGKNSSGPLSDGFAYDPDTDTWSPLPASGLGGRSDHSAVWSGTEMIIWGGGNGAGVFGNGAKYEPETGTWTFMSSQSSPTARQGHTAVWSGTEMMIWGGGNATGSVKVQSGHRYNPATNSWTAISNLNAPESRTGHTAVWTGSQMVVWGGQDADTNALQTGGRYDPDSDVWTDTSAVAAPGPRYGHTAVWAAGRMWVFGGGPGNLNDGAAFDPEANSWMPIADAQHSMGNHEAVWTGREMLVFGGVLTNALQRYDLEEDHWRSFHPGTAPDISSDTYRAVWTGSHMLIWGDLETNAGALFDPETGQWTSMSTVNAPVPRQDFSMTWTGTEVIVWGGVNFLNHDDSETGGRYNPLTDTWTALSTVNAPSGRRDHTAVWTGSKLMVWGGVSSNGFSALDSGGIYDPATDTWSPITTSGAPGSRTRHLAVWTGTHMEIYGGRSFTLAGGGEPTLYTDVGSYNPTTDSWNVEGSLFGDPMLSPAYVGMGNQVFAAHDSIRPATGSEDPVTVLSHRDFGSSTWSTHQMQGLYFHEGFHPQALLLEGRIVALSAHSNIHRVLGYAFDRQTGTATPIAPIPREEEATTLGPGVSDGTQILKYVNPPDEPGRVYGWKPGETLYVYQKL